ncbi:MULTISPECIES: class I SAM-dependent methyltransferase [Streptomyces]|nr:MULTISPECIES: class I SAM-dependent methyltransferase [Streptomyces]
MYEGVPSRWVYRRNGLAYLDHLTRMAGLTPNSRLLDVGSGLGRKAWPFIDYFQDGEYVGLEPRREAVDWCTQNLTSRDKRLRFEHIDVKNGYYTPGNSAEAGGFSLPAPDMSFDIVMANSVFTHMLPRDVGHYLAEFQRVLMPGGIAFCTFFLNPEEVKEKEELIAPPRYDFPHQRDGYRVQHADCDEHVVNYEETDVHSMHRQAGLFIAEIHWGSWRGGSTFTDFQDIVISRKRGSPQFHD